MDMDDIRMMLDADSVAHYEAKAMKAGRSWAEQIMYELKVNRGLVVPDVGDEDARQRANIIQRSYNRRILRG